MAVPLLHLQSERKKVKKAKWACLALAVILAPVVRAQESPAQAMYSNPDLPAEQRAADLVSRMSLDEKVLQMQNSAPAIPRLHIPAYDWWNEALHGVARAGLATVFPQAIGLAATWDTELMNRVAGSISTEARAKYHEALRQGDHSRYHGLTFWSPNINIFRDPRWGRGQETYGEDPFLTSRMAIAFIRGMQGDDPHYFKTIATAKHYAVHSGPEPLRHSFNVTPTARDLEQTYLPAFRASVMEGLADSVMCAYNRVDDQPACANTSLLQEHLRSSWRFQGYVVSDCGAISDIVKGHKYKETMPEAAAVAVRAGTDLACGREYATLVEAVHRGFIAEAEIDRALTRLFVARIKLGMFDPAERVPYAQIPYAQNDSPTHRQLALEAARESMVLLKNDGTILPLEKEPRSIAVIGPAADDPDTLLANYHGVPSRLVTPLAGLRSQLPKAQIRFAQGSLFSALSPALVPPDVLTAAVPKNGNPASPREPGLLAEYFVNSDLQGAPKLTRVEGRVYFERQMRDPAIEAQIPQNEYSVRWTGTLHAPYSGSYTIAAIRMHCEGCPGGDSAQIFLDNQPILRADRPHPGRQVKESSEIQLEKGRSYALRVEYRQTKGGTGMQLVWMPPAEPLLQEAVDTVKTSDLAIAFLGLNAQLEGEEMKISIPGFASGDRTSLDLPEPQEKLLEAAVRTGKPVVLVLLSGSAMAVNYAQEHAAAILDAWYAGEEAGTAIAQTLTGQNNPAGRLPVTFYRSVDQLPPFADYTMQARTYRYFQGQPLYPFGHGRSYSSFRYSGLRLEPVAGENSKIHVSAEVKNDSRLAGDEVVQVYVRGDALQAEDPLRELRGFERIHLKKGEHRRVEFTVDLSYSAFDPAPLGTPRKLLWISVGGGQPMEGVAYVEGIFPVP